MVVVRKGFTVHNRDFEDKEPIPRRSHPLPSRLFAKLKNLDKVSMNARDTDALRSTRRLLCILVSAETEEARISTAQPLVTVLGIKHLSLVYVAWHGVVCSSQLSSSRLETLPK